MQARGQCGGLLQFFNRCPSVLDHLPLNVKLADLVRWTCQQGSGILASPPPPHWDYRIAQVFFFFSMWVLGIELMLACQVFY